MKVGEIANKMQERRLKWYEHVMRRDVEFVGKRVMRMNVDVEEKERKTEAEVDGRC